MPFDTDSLAPFIPRLREARHCYVAYSGGLDSHVLLHAVVQLLGKDAVSAIHVNHQLSDNAADWQQHCLNQCEQLGVALDTETVRVDSSGLGVERAAREARYRVFEALLQSGDLLLMAHHLDDQVETVLYRLLRGSGVRGLSGIPQQRRLGAGELLRPLLNYRRSDLEAYAGREQLVWIDDDSNFAIDYDRNFLRHQVVPVLASRWPDHAERIAHSAALCADTDQLLDRVAASDLAFMAEQQERLGWSIALPELLDISPLRRASLLRHWVESRGYALPGHKILATIERELLTAREDAAPQVNWGDAQLRRFGERIYLLPGALNLAQLADQSLSWQPGSPLSLPVGSLVTKATDSGGLRINEGQQLQVRFRQGGERCRPAGRSASNTLKKLLQEARLEPWLRGFAPLIYIDGELAAVADLWVCEGFQSRVGESGWQLSWLLS